MDRKMTIAFLLVVFLISSSVPTLAEPMYKVNYKDVPAESVVREGFAHVQVRYLVTEKHGAKNFAMRLFEFAPGGHTSYHTHPWEHEIFILEGEGIVIGGEQQQRFKEGHVIFIPPNEKHQIKNTSKRTAKFLCLIPYRHE